MRKFFFFLAVTLFVPVSQSLITPTLSLAGWVSEDEVWTFFGSTETDPLETVGPYKYTTFAVDAPKLDDALSEAPLEFTTFEAGAIMTLPMPDGSYMRVRIEESPIFSTELQQEYPEIRTYTAKGLDDPTVSGRLDHTPAGFHAMLISESGTVYVDPADDYDPTHYISFWKKDVAGEHYMCGQHDETDHSPLAALLAFPANNPSGDQLRTYRLAVSATGEYTQFFGGMANAANQIATTINRVTGIYEREVAIRLNLVATNIYDDQATDPFTGDDVSAMLGENQTDLDANVGNANYDFGHIFSQGGSGGVANVGVCTAGSKARGATSLANPSGDVFDVDFVAHEMGHQLSGSHTWNGTSGSCTAGQFQAASSYEPGSGSTIMAYAGICAGQNVQANSDDYFHTRSFDQITAYRNGTGACGTLAATGNAPPTVEAGPNCTIPTSTPFTLIAQGDDADGDPMTFNWEQFDLGTQDGNPQSTFTTGPLFRSRPATSDPSRTFPQFQDILSGAATPYEVLPSVDRTLNFRVTVRDNQPNGGGVDYDSMSVTVSGNPFEVTAPATGATLECGDSDTFTWDVGGGSVAPNVEILFSSDGGTTFSSLVGSTTNDGSHDVTVPTELTGTGRIMLEPSQECFFAVSEEFSIVDTTPPTITAPADIVAECTSPNGTPVNLGIPTVNDLCDASVNVSNDAPALFPLGSTTVDWIATDDSSNSAMDTQNVTINDTTPPSVFCNAPNIIVPPDVPISFTATATDVCDAEVEVVVTGFECFMFTKKGKKIDKGESCVVTFGDDTVNIFDSGGVGDHIKWTIVATDDSGNQTVDMCEVVVANPGQS